MICDRKFRTIWRWRINHNR